MSACDMSMSIVHPENAFAEVSIGLSVEARRHGFTTIMGHNPSLRQHYVGFCGIVETKAKSATAWPDCVCEWNIRDP